MVSEGGAVVDGVDDEGVVGVDQGRGLVVELVVGGEDGCGASKPGDTFWGGNRAREDVGEDCLAELERELEEVASRSWCVAVFLSFVLGTDRRFIFVQKFLTGFWQSEGIVCCRVVWIWEV